MIIPLVSADLRADPCPADYTSSKDVALHFRLEPERGLYMAGSTDVIVRALQIGHSPRFFLMSECWLLQLAPLIRETIGDEGGGEVPILTTNEDVLRQITGFHLHWGTPAAMQRPPLPTVPEPLPHTRGGKSTRRVVISEDLVDHTNIEAALRPATALGVDAVLVTPSCADPLCRRSVCVSVETVFQIPWTRLEGWPTTDELHGVGFTLAALALCDDSISPEDFVESSLCIAPDAKVTFIMGTEGDGLNRKTIAICDVVVRILMSGGVNSLNVIAASAAVFWATRKVGA